MKAIRLENLTKYYGKARGIIELNLDVEEGAFFGFIGPNGAGKSTTIRTMLGLIAPSNGSAKVWGMDIVKDRRKILENVGYLPSETTFYPGMRVRDILQFSADLRKKDCSKECMRLCERLKLDADRKAGELSLGNRKKAGIVCALQHKPKVLILDEPTSGLDPLMQREFFSILQEYNKEGTTIFLSSHVLSEIQRNCTRAAIIREGRIIAHDSVEALSKTSAKRVTVHGKADWEKLSGVRDLQESGGGVSFLYAGDMGRLVQILSQGNIRDLTVAEPDLEEIFMHYYAAEEENNDNHQA